MKKWIVEDWEFIITIKEGEAEHCRLGFETGDVFTCQYEVPSGFCSKTMATLHTLCNSHLLSAYSPSEFARFAQGNRETSK